MSQNGVLNLYCHLQPGCAVRTSTNKSIKPASFSSAAFGSCKEFVGELWCLFSGESAALSQEVSPLVLFAKSKVGTRNFVPGARTAVKGLKGIIWAAALIRLSCGGHETEFGRRFFVWSSLGSKQSCDLRGNEGAPGAAGCASEQEPWASSGCPSRCCHTRGWNWSEAAPVRSPQPTLLLVVRVSWRAEGAEDAQGAMSGPREDGRCRRAISILTELCQKKSLPSLDLDTCREFLLLPSDQSLIISEPGKAPSPICWRMLMEGRRDTHHTHPLHGEENVWEPHVRPKGWSWHP